VVTGVVVSGEVRAGTEVDALAGFEALRDRLAVSLVDGDASRHQVPALCARLVKTLEAIEDERVGPVRKPGSRRSGTEFSRGPARPSPAVQPARPVPDDLRDAVKLGLRPGLIAVRRVLADLLDGPNVAARIVAPAARTLTDVIAKIDALPDECAPLTKREELRARRDLRLELARQELTEALTGGDVDDS
jgi:hypothetical protein